MQADEHGTPPAIVVHFEDPDLRGTYRMPHFVNLLVTNTTSETLSVSLTLVGFGLDQRRSDRSYGSYDLRGGEQRTIPIAAARFPLRSHSAPATIFAEGRVTVNGQRLSVASERLTAAFDRALSTVTFHGIGNALRDLRHPHDPRRERRQLRSLAAELLNVAGEVWVTDRYVPVGRLPPNGAGGGTIRYSGGSDTNEPWPASLPDPLATQPHYEGPVLGPNQAQLCGSWLAKFVDSGFGEDHMASKDWSAEPARFAAAQIWRADTAEVLFAGHLNAFGCTPIIQLAETGTYVLTFFSTLRKDESKIDIQSVNSLGGFPHYTFMSSAFVKTGPNALPLTLDFPSPLPITYSNTAAVMGLALATPDNGFPAVANATTVTLYDDCCQSGVCAFACASGDYTTKEGSITFGRSNKKLPSGHYIMTTDYKYTIGHELGHVIQHFNSGRFHQNYGAWKTDEAPLLCTCEHVDSSNPFRCLQSREHTSTAHIEAFAHFYANKLFNDPNGGDCMFVYYKDVKHFGITLPPPVPTDCTYPVRWLENECLAPDRGVQWDWNNFLWSIYTAPPAQRTTLDDLFAIYRQGCGTYCQFDPMDWPTFDGAADLYYGGTENPRYQQLLDSANDYGVDH